MYRPVPSIGSKSCLWVVGWMYQVDVYLRVCRAVMVDGMSIREVSRVFGLHRDTVRKILAYSAPPGYRRQTPPRRPKLEPFTGVIDQILVDDLRRPRKQRHTAQRIFRRLRDEHGLGHCCWTLEVVRAEVQGIRVESVLPCLRARPGGLLEREDVRAVEMQSQDGGGSGWIARKRPRSVPAHPCVESVLPCLRARPGGLLEREDVARGPSSTRLAPEDDQVPQERETAETDQFSLLAPPRIGVRACVRTQS